jgi:nucleotide sugar dehydrogenase
MGYVGLPIAVRAAEVGHEVIGVDVSQDKIDSIATGMSYIEDVSDERLQAVVASGALRATDLSERHSFEIALITVPTPVDAMKRPDLQFIEAGANYVASCMNGGEVVVLESTTYPGTTEDVVAERIRRIAGLEPERDYMLGYSPERINPGDSVNTFDTVPKIVSGTDAASLARIQSFYDTLVQRTVPVSSPRAAELAKVFENTFAQVNIALVNELALVCSELGLDVDEVLDAAATKGHSIMRFRPGPGVGGHCISVDPLYLTWMRRNMAGKAFRFAELADEINGGMPEHVVHRARSVLNDHGVPIWNSRIGVLGVAYKPNVADIRESPALVLVERLRETGAEVSVFDPHVNTAEDAELAAKSAGSFDLMIVATDHDDFDYEAIHKGARVILDTRNRYPRGTARVHKL